MFSLPVRLSALALAAPIALAAQSPRRNASLPAASPDGKSIAFMRAQGRTGGIYLMDADGQNVRRISLDSTRIDGTPVWTPDGAWIVFDSRSGASMTEPTEIAIMRPDGSERRVIARGPMFQWARVSPDGKRIAFAGALEPLDPAMRRRPPTGVFVVNIDGTQLAKFPTGLAGAWDPEWSPDGKQIAFGELPDFRASADQIVSRIYVADVSGGSPRLVATVKGVIQWPSWSPDGKTIAYQTSDSRTDSDIVLMDVATGNLKPITHHDGRKFLDETPRWTRDGRIVFQSTRDGSYEVYVMNADGTNQRRVSPPGPEQPTATAAPAVEEAPPGVTALSVMNSMPHTMTVSATLDGRTVKLGPVEGGKARLFRLDEALVGTIAVTATLDGTDHVVKGTVAVKKGVTAKFTIE